MSATRTAPDLFRSEHQPLNAFFTPRSVAVIGAWETPDRLGRTLLWNLIRSPFGGTVFPVSSKYPSILGIKAYPTLAEVPDSVDLAVIATAADTVPSILQDCVKIGVKAAIILSAGFREMGASGIVLEQQILDIARRGNLPILGPNCLGLMNPLTGLNATLAKALAKPGNVGCISQSDALCTSILDWSFQENVGFSAFISIGSMLDIGWGDLIYYLGDDPQTQSILIYMESIGDARSFLSAAREVALTKPIIVIKAGRTAPAAQAATSHTGALAGSDQVLDAAFRRCGVLRVYNLTDLFSMAEVLAKQPHPKGSRLTILTNAGGPGVLTTDTLILEGGTLAQLSEETVESLNLILPPQWSHSNPIDILGDADPERYAKALEIAVQDPNSDGVLVILTPQAMTDPTQTAEKIKAFVCHHPKKPILASWMGGAEVKAGADILNQAGIATFPYPDIGVRMFNYMRQYHYNLQGLYETPSLPATVITDESLVCDRAQYLIESVCQQGRTVLTEFESKQLLATYNIPVVETQIATTVEAAIQAAEMINYPVVLKLHSHRITHKTDVGGVQLNLKNREAVIRAYHSIQNNICKAVGAEHFQGVTVQPMVQLEGYELIVGSHLDPQFGPVLLFGTGGQLVEVFQDKSLALPPLNTTLARRMMEQTKIYKALLGVRGRTAVDLDGLEKILVQFSDLVVEHPRIKEIEINPLFASETGFIALDARVILHDPQTAKEQLPQPAIRPYPYQYITHWISKTGLDLVIRPIRPEDEPMAVKFHESLSAESVYLRYAHLLKLSRRIAHDRLSRLCFIDYNCEMALVAIYTDPQTATEQIVGVGRLSRVHGVHEAEFSLLICDRFQHQGLGSELLRQLLSIGRQENIDRITAEILADNFPMQKICERLGFTLHRVMGEPMFQADIQL